MKPNLTRPFTTLLLALTLCLTALTGRAQSDTVTISAAEFQRMVYSGHLHTQFSEKPELDACLQVLLELQRRNPQADPAALAELSRQALQSYRTNAPAYIRTNGHRDEILAAYLDALRQVPDRTDFVPANLSLLNHFMLGPEDRANATAAELIHSRNQRVFSSRRAPAQRQALLDTCTARAQANTAFRAALDGLLLPEILVSLTTSSTNILGNPNFPVSSNLTLRTLLTNSLASGNGSVTISSNTLMSLFTAEALTIRNAVSNTLASRAEFNRSHPDFLSYLGNPAAVQARELEETAMNQRLARTIASSTAAINVQSKLLEAPDSVISDEVKAIGSMLFQTASAIKGKDPAALIPVLFEALDFAGIGGGESEAEATLRELGNIKTMIRELGTNIDHRFDRVDQSLTTIFDTLNEGFNRIDSWLNTQGHQISQLLADTAEIRTALVEIQTAISRLERALFESFLAGQRSVLKGQLSAALFYEFIRNEPMTWNAYSSVPGHENNFYDYATTKAQDPLASPVAFLPADLAAPSLQRELEERDLDANLNYVKQVLSSLGSSTLGTPPLSNPQDWFTGAYAYLQLAVENPDHFRRLRSDVQLDDIIDDGQNLNNFFASLSFTGFGVNRRVNTNLFDTLLGNEAYAGKLNAFNTQVLESMRGFGALSQFAVDAWRQWASAPARVNATATEVQDLIRLLRGGTRITCRDNFFNGPNFVHFLAVRSDLKVETGFGELPTWSNVVAVAAGGSHNLALKNDGTVVALGDNGAGQSTVPAGLTEVVAIAAGGVHSLALQRNGTVVAWGEGFEGQANVPPGLSGVVAIAAGGWHSLALKSDGSVVAWGAGRNNTGNDREYGQSIVPPDALSGVMAIAAGDVHSLALKNNGTVVAWGSSSSSQTTVPVGAQSEVVAIAGGFAHSLALKRDGTVVAWGWNATGVPADLTGVVAIAAGGNASIAAKSDCTLVSWGAVNVNGLDLGYGPPMVAAGTSNVVAVAAGVDHVPGERPPRLALLADGTVAGWGINWRPFELTLKGIAIYTSDVSTDAANRVGSQLAMQFDPGFGAHYVRDNVVLTNVDNFGIELWVKPSTASGNHAIACNGNPGSSGWGLYQIGNTYRGVFGGVAFIGASGVTPGVWTHLALVRNNGTATLYVNGAASGTDLRAPLAPAGGFALGASPGGTEHLEGALDEVRVFTFDQFVPANLLSGPDYSAVNTVGHWRLGEDDAGAVSGAIGTATTAGQRAVGLTSVQAISAGAGHALALRSNGTVVAWGANINGQNNVPPGLANVAAIAAGAYHSLALQSNSAVVGWGDNAHGQTDIAGWANVTAIAAGGQHSLALKSDGKVVGRGDNSHGQLNNLDGLTDVVAIAAGACHSLALKSDGKVVGWGDNSHGQLNNLDGLTNVVAIAAGARHSLALKSDGKVVGRGDNSHGQLSNLEGLTDVVAMAAGEWFSLFVRGTSTSGSGQPLSFVQAGIPSRVKNLFQSANLHVVTNLTASGPLQDAVTELSGTKALLTAVLELALPYTLERDDILHGFLYGSESLADLEVSRAFLTNENARLQAAPNSPPAVPSDIASPRFHAFANRLHEQLGKLAESGQPEIPRLVGHTLSLLNLLRDAWTQPANSPPSALEIISRSNNDLALALHGEPYGRYTLQESTNAWTAPGTNVWTPVPGITFLRSADSPLGTPSTATTSLPISTGTRVHYYRAGPPAP